MTEQVFDAMVSDMRRVFRGQNVLKVERDGKAVLILTEGGVMVFKPTYIEITDKQVAVADKAIRGKRIWDIMHEDSCVYVGGNDDDSFVWFRNETLAGWTLSDLATAFKGEN